MLRGLPVKPARPGEQTLWEQAMDDWWWLDRYQLTPSQVDEIPLASYTRIPEIAAEAEKLRKEKMDKG